MNDNVVILPVVAVERDKNRLDLPFRAPLLRRIGWAIDDCMDDDRPGIAAILEEARAKIIRLSAGSFDSGKDQR